MIKLTALHTEHDIFSNSESGFSILIETENKRILFDTSYSDDIVVNSEQAGIDLTNIDCIILSHGHVDHTDGLRFIDFSDVKSLIAHPDCFQKKYREGYGYIGCPLLLEDLKSKTSVILSKEPYWIESDSIVFLGEIPRKTDFEGDESVGNLESGEADFLLDDSAVAMKTEKGIIIVSGCSHSGICNIIEYAKEVCNEKRIVAVIGGFHLFSKEKTDKTLEFIKNESIEQVYPCHCLDGYAFSEFDKIGAKKLHTLQKLNF